MEAARQPLANFHGEHKVIFSFNYFVLTYNIIPNRMALLVYEKREKTTEIFSDVNDEGFLFSN